jgi:hypothetical protein
MNAAPITALSKRAQSVLMRLGIETPGEAADAIARGVLKIGVNGPHNYGAVTHREVCKWAGVPWVQSCSVANVISDLMRVFPSKHGYQVTSYRVSVVDQDGKPHCLQWPNGRLSA